MGVIQHFVWESRFCLLKTKKQATFSAFGLQGSSRIIQKYLQKHPKSTQFLPYWSYFKSPATLLSLEVHGVLPFITGGSERCWRNPKPIFLLNIEEKTSVFPFHFITTKQIQNLFLVVKKHKNSSFHFITTCFFVFSFFLVFPPGRNQRPWHFLVVSRPMGGSLAKCRPHVVSCWREAWLKAEGLGSSTTGVFFLRPLQP